MKSIRHIVLGIAAVTSLGMASAASAQQGPGQFPPTGMGPMGMHGPQGMPGARGPGTNLDMAAMVDARLAKAKVALKITGDQETLWNNLSGTVKNQAEAMKGVREAALRETGTTVPKRMVQHIAMAKLHLTHMETLQPHVDALYAKLTDEQKAIADKLLGRMHRRMGPPAN